ncbi:hypothetical protein FO519_005453 [Halicephalobus sp. NKZ332]|nr:hypothetical protein FO519_005453 [Halicephalobus sp. NKZ332]
MERIRQLDFPYHEILNLVYTSDFNSGSYPVVGNLPILPLRTDTRGPAPRSANGKCYFLPRNDFGISENDPDIVDEALTWFRPIIFTRSFKIRGGADRVLIYLFLYVIECLKQLHGVNQEEATRRMRKLAISEEIPLPGDQKFPANDFLEAPKNKQERDTMAQYLQQLRREVGDRLCILLFKNTDIADKHWTMYGHRRFLNRSFTR